MNSVFCLIWSLRAIMLRFFARCSQPNLYLCTAKVASFMRCILRPEDMQLISAKFATMFVNFRGRPIPHSRKSCDVLEGRQIYGWSREDCRALRGCAKTALGVALILTSRICTFCVNTSIRATCELNVVYAK